MPDSQSEHIRMHFGQNLKRLRRLAAISQEELGFRAGLHRTAISCLERGMHMPRLEAILKLAGALEVSPGELLEGLAWSPGWLVRGQFEIDGVSQLPRLNQVATITSDITGAGPCQGSITHPFVIADG